MPTILEDQSPVTRGSMVEKCVEVLNAGGTVYLGETHTERHGREICIEVLRQRCVQHLCLEFNSTEDELVHKSPALIDTAERVIGHRPEVAMSGVIAACTTSGGSYHLVDKQGWPGHEVESTERQRHLADGVKLYRRQITMVGRGVLVLIGSDHLVDLDDGDTRWTALPKLVYEGTTFMHGIHESCVMMWQLS